jgi:addiction module HigA family antidote
MAKRLPAIHPGEILREEFLTPMELTPYAVAKAIGVPRTRIERLAREETPLTADTALRLARISTPQQLSGWACRLSTIWRLLPIRSTESSSVSSRGGQPEPARSTELRLEHATP